MAIVAVNAERRGSIGAGVDAEVISARRIADPRKEIVQRRHEPIAHRRDMLLAVVENDADFVLRIGLADSSDVLVGGFGGALRHQRWQPLPFDLLSAQKEPAGRIRRGRRRGVVLGGAAKRGHELGLSEDRRPQRVAEDVRAAAPLRSQALGEVRFETVYGINHRWSG